MAGFDANDNGSIADSGDRIYVNDDDHGVRGFMRRVNRRQHL